MNIQMVDVVGQYKKIKPDVDAAIHRVLDSGMFIQGKEVGELECAVAGRITPSRAWRSPPPSVVSHTWRWPRSRGH